MAKEEEGEAEEELSPDKQERSNTRGGLSLLGKYISQLCSELRKSMDESKKILQQKYHQSDQIIQCFGDAAMGLEPQQVVKDYMHLVQEQTTNTRRRLKLLADSIQESYAKLKSSESQDAEVDNDEESDWDLVLNGIIHLKNNLEAKDSEIANLEDQLAITVKDNSKLRQDIIERRNMIEMSKKEAKRKQSQKIVAGMKSQDINIHNSVIPLQGIKQTTSSKLSNHAVANESSLSPRSLSSGDNTIILSGEPADTTIRMNQINNHAYNNSKPPTKRFQPVSVSVPTLSAIFPADTISPSQSRRPTMPHGNTDGIHGSNSFAKLYSDKPLIPTKKSLDSRYTHRTNSIYPRSDQMSKSDDFLQSKFPLINNTSRGGFNIH